MPDPHLPEGQRPASTPGLRPGEATPAGLPVYALYGEPGETPATDWLHIETIAQRSRLHDWEIRPHRHATLFQILYIRQGRAQASLESGSLALLGPCVLRVPALVPHGFRFEPAIEGVVLTVLEAHLRRLLAGAEPLAEQMLQTGLSLWVSAEPAASQLDQAMARLQAEHAASVPWRGLALDAALLQVLVALGRLDLARPAPAEPVATAHPADAAGGAAGRTRAVAVSAPPRPARAQAHVQRFRQLVDQRFRQQPSLAELAAALGITPTQLNRVCQQVLGHSALGVLHGRLLLEAQRELAYTGQGIKQIAHGLGFADAGYFARFFQRACGHTPSAWRAMAAR